MATWLRTVLGVVVFIVTVPPAIDIGIVIAFVEVKRIKPTVV